MSSDTIFALSSGGGRAGVAVFRVSGAGAAAIVDHLCDGALSRGMIVPRRASLRWLTDSLDRSRIDQGLVLWMPGPASFTGEDMVEFHVHGGRAVVAALTAALSRSQGARAAEPGEFTWRAFHNGKIDLAQVEGLADLVNAETEAQRRISLANYEGRARAQLENWRDRILSLMARVEAAIDFVDEELPEDLLKGVVDDLSRLAIDLKNSLRGAEKARLVRDGVKIAIAGPPNVGKSTLLNALAGREAAIVSEIAGATRDVIEVRLDLGGYAAIIADMAGLRDARDPLEAEGVRRAKAWVEEADILLSVRSAKGGVDAGFDDLDDVVKTLEDAADGKICAIVLNKADLINIGSTLDSSTVISSSSSLSLSPSPSPSPSPSLSLSQSTPPTFWVSALTGEGLDSLIEWLTETVSFKIGDGEDYAFGRVRQQRALIECVESIERGADALKDIGAIDVTAEELRAANAALGRITGRIGVEEALGRIFSEFCIGK